MDLAARLEQIRAAGAKMSVHLHYAHGYGYVYKCVAEPRICIGVFNPKPKHRKKHPPSKIYTVDGLEAQFLTLEEAVAAVAKIDADAEEARRWDAAAPAKAKPCEIPGMLEEGHK